MNIEVKALKEPYPYSKIAELFKKTYFQEYLESGALMWNEKYAKFYIDSVFTKKESKKFIYGAFIGERLIASLFGHREAIMLDDEVKLEELNLGLLAVDPEYRRQGIAKTLLSKLIDGAKKENIDLLIAFPEKGRYGDNLLKDHFDFKSFGKIKHLIKLMEDKGLQVLSEYMNKNPILVKLASLYSQIPVMDEPEGIIRNGVNEDFPEVINLLNSYHSRVPLSFIYTEEGYSASSERFFALNVLFGDPWNHYWIILENKNKIYASLNYRIEMVTFQSENNGLTDLPVCLLANVAFREEMELDQKVKFIDYILHKIRSEIPDVFITQITSCQHEEKAFRKLKFPSDQSLYIFLMKPLTKKGEKINRYNKYQEFLLHYYR